MGKSEGGYRWEEGGVRGRVQSEPRTNPHRTYSEPTARGRWRKGGEAGTGEKGSEEGGGVDVEQINFAAAQ